MSNHLHHTCDSNGLDFVHYNPDEKELDVKFADRTDKSGAKIPGATYRYHDVPLHVYSGFLTAKTEHESKSEFKYFVAEVKNKPFKFTRLGP